MKSTLPTPVPMRPARAIVATDRAVSARSAVVLEKSAGTYANPQDLDHTQAGLFGLELAYYRFCQLPEAGCMLGVAGESAYGAGLYLGVAGLFTGTDTLVDEPVIFPEIAGVNSQPYATLCSVGNDVYLVGDTVVYRGARQTATTSTLEPVRYRYDDHTGEIDFAVGIDPLYVGQLLTITRTLSWEAQSGSETVRAIIVRVEQRTDCVKVVALDAVGWLGVARCRRPAILNDGAAGSGVIPLLVGLLVLSIGLSLGGPTGYAINPARDLGPRIAHAFLPIAGKGDSDWGYALVPVVAPIVGGILGSVIFNVVWPG